MVEIFNNPGFLSAKSTFGSDISYLFAVIFTALFLIAGRFAFKRQGGTHHRMILISMVTMIAYFTYYYLVRRLGLASLEDQINFDGPPWVYQKVFKPVLMIHFLMVSLSTFIAIYMVGNGFRTSYVINNRLVLRNEPVRSSKALWGAGFIWLAILVWWAFSTPLFGWGHRSMMLFLGYFLPLALTLAIRRALPKSERRHRILGRICLALFAGLLLTSSVAYYLLYLAF